MHRELHGDLPLSIDEHAERSSRNPFYFDISDDRPSCDDVSLEEFNLDEVCSEPPDLGNGAYGL